MDALYYGKYFIRKAIGWFFILLGSLSLLQQIHSFTGAQDSLVLGFLCIINGYGLIKAKEFARLLTIWLSLFTMTAIGLSLSSPGEFVSSGFCGMQSFSRWSSYAALLLYALLAFYFNLSLVKKQFNTLEQALYQAENKNREMTIQAQDLEGQIKRLKQALKNKNDIIDNYFNEAKYISTHSGEDAAVSGVSFKDKREKDKKRIGEILLESELITKVELERALEYQKQYGGSVTQFLLKYGHIKEKDLVKCLCAEFGVPYLPLSSYDISDEVIKLVPADIAEKYWVMPVDKQGDTLTVVMIDPLDSKAIKQLENLTDLKIRPFVGIISEIAAALRLYYKVLIMDNDSSDGQLPQFFLDSKLYKGVERRESLRFDCAIAIKFPLGEHYAQAKTINVSRNGFAFYSDKPVPLGVITLFDIALPPEYSVLPIAAVMQVVRCVPLAQDKFEVGVKMLKISKQELELIISYASSQAHK